MFSTIRGSSGRSTAVEDDDMMIPLSLKHRLNATAAHVSDTSSPAHSSSDVDISDLIPPSGIGHREKDGDRKRSVDRSVRSSRMDAKEMDMETIPLAIPPAKRGRSSTPPARSSRDASLKREESSGYESKRSSDRRERDRDRDKDREKDRDRDRDRERDRDRDRLSHRSDRERDRDYRDREHRSDREHRGDREHREHRERRRRSRSKEARKKEEEEVEERRSVTRRMTDSVNNKRVIIKREKLSSERETPSLSLEGDKGRQVKEQDLDPPQPIVLPTTIDLNARPHPLVPRNVAVSSGLSVANSSAKIEEVYGPKVSAPASSDVEDSRRIRKRDAALRKWGNLMNQWERFREAMEYALRKEDDGEIRENVQHQILLSKEMKDQASLIRSLNRELGLPEDEGMTQDYEDSSVLPPTQTNVQFFDSERYWCRLCGCFPRTIREYLDHVKTLEHTQKAEASSSDQPWRLSFEKAREGEPKKTGLSIPTAIKGSTFLISAHAWYCTLCDTWLPDYPIALFHMTSYRHNRKYSEHCLSNPAWEPKWYQERDSALLASKAGGTDPASSMSKSARKQLEEAAAASAVKKSSSKKDRKSGSHQHSSNSKPPSTSEAEKELFEDRRRATKEKEEMELEGLKAKLKLKTKAEQDAEALPQPVPMPPAKPQRHIQTTVDVVPPPPPRKQEMEGPALNGSDYHEHGSKRGDRVRDEGGKRSSSVERRIDSERKQRVTNDVSRMPSKPPPPPPPPPRTEVKMEVPGGGLKGRFERQQKEDSRKKAEEGLSKEREAKPVPQSEAPPTDAPLSAPGDEGSGADGDRSQKQEWRKMVMIGKLPNRRAMLRAAASSPTTETNAESEEALPAVAVSEEKEQPLSEYFAEQLRVVKEKAAEAVNRLKIEEEGLEEERRRHWMKPPTPPPPPSQPPPPPLHHARGPLLGDGPDPYGNMGMGYNTMPMQQQQHPAYYTPTYSQPYGASAPVYNPYEQQMVGHPPGMMYDPNMMGPPPTDWGMGGMEDIPLPPGEEFMGGGPPFEMEETPLEEVEMDLGEQEESPVLKKKKTMNQRQRKRFFEQKHGPSEPPLPPPLPPPPPPQIDAEEMELLGLSNEDSVLLS